MIYDSSLVDANFANAHLDYAGLSFCQATERSIYRCDCPGADFVNAIYKNG